MKRFQAGFTILEVLVVVAIIAMLAAVVIPRLQDGSAQSRDIDRQGDLRTLQSAIELFKQEHGRYPEGCRGPNVWSGQIGTAYQCPDIAGRDSGVYIVGIPSENINFTPDYIRALPKDPKLNGSDSGYVYTTNPDGTVYKLMAKRTVESETIDYQHPFKSCDSDGTAATEPVCNRTLPTNNTPPWCRTTGSADRFIFLTSYGVWGGYADESTPARVEQYTEDIICDIK